MADAAPYVVTSFALEAEFKPESGGVIIFKDVISIAATFGLNSIPVAQLVVATGKNAQTDELASIHKNKGRLKHGTEVTVRLTVTNHDGQLDKIEQGTFVIFHGRFAGIGYQRSYDAASYTIHLVHWLDYLNHGSMVNGNWFPGAPYDLAQNALYTALGPAQEGNAGLRGDPTPQIDANRKIVNWANIRKDLWGEVIKPIFKKIAAWPLPHYQDMAQGGEENNKLVLEALEKMPGDGAKYYSNLRLDMEGLQSENVAESIRLALGKDAMDSFAYTTFWNKLVGEYAPQFYFAISPCTEYALPIPFFAGLSTPWKTIKSDEYNYANFNASMMLNLESVDIFYPVQSSTGYQIGPSASNAPVVSFRTPMGWYPPQDQQNRRGYKLLKEPPTWMTNLFPGPAFAARSTGIGAEGKDVCVPDRGDKNPPNKFFNGSGANYEAKKSGALTRFAEHWYKTEVLYQRHGELSGKLRFDIAPGSIIAIETPEYDLDKKDKLHATVTQVSYAINAETAQAGTSFTLAHIRTEDENEDQFLTANKPPLYRVAWRGAPLAEKK